MPDAAASPRSEPALEAETDVADAITAQHGGAQLGDNPESPASRTRPELLPAAVLAGGSNASSEGWRRVRRELWTPRRYHKWKSPLLMSTFFVLGLGISIAHCTFYAALNGAIVGSPRQQQTNLRQARTTHTPSYEGLICCLGQDRFGTAFAFLSQIALSASCWQTYTQWIWRSVKEPLSLAMLNKMFDADISFLSFLSFELLQKFTVGYAIGLFAWTLILPPFFTPGTLFVYDSTNKVVVRQAVPFLTIANSTAGHNYSGYQDFHGTENHPHPLIYGDSGRTDASNQGTDNHSSYTVNFFGPAVQCLEASPAVKSKIGTLLEVKMNETVVGAREIQNSYYGFVPAFDSQGSVTALTDVRYQTQLNASNEIWMVFERYNSSTEACKHDKYYQVCNLWNATYDLNLSWVNGFQNISGSRRLLHTVEYPRDKAGAISNMAQHAYSAFMWVLGDQVVGSFGWFETTDPNNSSNTEQFGVINSPIQHNVLLGSSDMDVFFDYNENVGACRTPYKELNLQRQQDIDLARNRTLSELIEELSFNMTVSLMHDDLLTKNVTRLVTRWDNVNRYGYDATGLFVPYVLACLFTLVTVLIGATIYVKHGVMPGKKFQDILAAADHETIPIARERDAHRHSMSAPFDGDHRTFRLAANAQ